MKVWADFLEPLIKSKRRCKAKISAPHRVEQLWTKS